MRTGIAEQKEGLRRQALAARRKMGAAARAQASEAIMQRLLAMPELAGSAPVAGYAPMRDEADIRRILELWATAGRPVAVPRVVAGSRNLTWHQICDFSLDLTTGYCGIREPRLGAAEIDPATFAAALIPSVAADRSGMRLGFGGGFYDTNLPKLTRALFVSPMFSCQLVASCPAQEHDRRLDCIVTERELLRCR